MNKILEWLSKLDFRTFLALVASFSVPVGPAFFFGWTFGTSVYSLVTPYAPGIAGFAAAVVGLMVAVGLESVGMLSGYNSIRAWNAAAYGEAVLASLSLGVYVVLGISGVEGTLFGLDILQVTTVFLMTPTAYIQMAVHYSLNRKEKVEQVTAEDAAADRREQERVAHEDKVVQDKLAHEEKLAQDQRDHEFKMAQLQAQKEARIAGDAAAAQAKAEIARVNAEARKFRAETNQVSPMFPGSFQVSQETKKETMEKHWKPGIGPTELAQLAGVTKGYASKFISGRGTPAHQGTYTNGVATKDSLVAAAAQLDAERSS